MIEIPTTQQKNISNLCMYLKWKFYAFQCDESNNVIVYFIN